MHLIFFLSILEYLQPDILPRNMVQNICMPDGIFRYSSLKVNLYEDIFVVYFLYLLTKIDFRGILIRKVLIALAITTKDSIL